MAEIGKVSLNEMEAYVIYAVESGTQVAEIMDFDAEGFRFLSDLDPGSVIALQEKNGNQLKLLVRKINIGKNIECQAILTE